MHTSARSLTLSKLQPYFVMMRWKIWDGAMKILVLLFSLIYQFSSSSLYNSLTRSADLLDGRASLPPDVSSLDRFCGVTVHCFLPHSLFPRPQFHIVASSQSRRVWERSTRTAPTETTPVRLALCYWETQDPLTNSISHIYLRSAGVSDTVGQRPPDPYWQIHIA